MNEPNTHEELWRDIPGYEGSYRVSDQGRVRSLDRVIQTKQGLRSVKGRTLKLTLQGVGYLSVGLYLDGVKHGTKFVHQLVLLAFVGPRPEGMVSRHLNSIPLDNRRVNLAYGTYAQNTQDAKEAGTLARGSAHGRSKLTETQVLEIRKRSEEGASGAGLGRAFGVTEDAIYCIINRKTWRHL